MSDSQKKIYSGGCLCGAIQYEVSHIGKRMGHCHCSMCRKFHGAAFATYGESHSADFRWIKGEEHLKSYHAKNNTTRQFCEICGSSLTFSSSNYEDDMVEFALATLDDEVGIKPDAHIYTRYKASWYSIEDDLPQFHEGRGIESAIQHSKQEE